MKLFYGYVQCQRIGYTPAIFAFCTTAINAEEAIGKGVQKGRDILPGSEGYESHTAVMSEVPIEMIESVASLPPVYSLALLAKCILAREQLRGLDAPGENGRDMALKTISDAIAQAEAVIGKCDQCNKSALVPGACHNHVKLCGCGQPMHPDALDCTQCFRNRKWTQKGKACQS